MARSPAYLYRCMVHCLDRRARACLHAVFEAIYLRPRLLAVNDVALMFQINFAVFG